MVACKRPFCLELRPFGVALPLCPECDAAAPALQLVGMLRALIDPAGYAYETARQLVALRAGKLAK